MMRQSIITGYRAGPVLETRLRLTPYLVCRVMACRRSGKCPVENMASASVTVLLVDDDLLVQDVIRSALEDGGFEVVGAAAGTQAMAILDDSAVGIQALVTDVNLGHGESGWDVARYGRELNAVLPVVYVSGDSAHDWPVHGVPGSILVQKPFAPVQIVTAVATVLNDAPVSPPGGPAA